MEAWKITFGALCLSSATGLSLYWMMFLISNFALMLRYGLTTPTVYLSTGIIGSVSVALCLIGIVSVRETLPAKPVKTLVLVRNAQGRVVSINQTELPKSINQAELAKVKPNSEAPQQGRHGKAKAVVSGLALTAVVLGFYISMMTMSGYTIQDVTGGMFSPFMAVSSQSMQPILNYGDLILVKREKAENIEVGDIIAFNVPSPYDKVAPSPTVHRVVEKGSENGEIYFKTKGDNNCDKDPWNVPAQNLIGKYVGKAPYIGMAVLSLKSLYGQALIAALLAASFIYSHSKKRTGGEQVGARND
jgi:signal peptidase I